MWYVGDLVQKLFRSSRLRKQIDKPRAAAFPKQETLVSWVHRGLPKAQRRSTEPQGIPELLLRAPQGLPICEMGPFTMESCHSSGVGNTGKTHTWLPRWLEECGPMTV